MVSHLGNEGTKSASGVYSSRGLTLVGRNDDMTSLRLDTGAVDLEILSGVPFRSGRSRSIGVDDIADAEKYNIYDKGPVTNASPVRTTIRGRDFWR